MSFSFNPMWTQITKKDLNRLSRVFCPTIKKMLVWLYSPSSLAVSICISKLLVISVLVSPRYLTCHGCTHFPGNHGRPPWIQECLGKSTNVLQTFGGWVAILKEAILGCSNILTGSRFPKQKERLLNKKGDCKRLPGSLLHWIPGQCPQLPVKRNCLITK